MSPSAERIVSDLAHERAVMEAALSGSPARVRALLDEVPHPHAFFLSDLIEAVSSEGVKAVYCADRTGRWAVPEALLEVERVLESAWVRKRVTEAVWATDPGALSAGLDEKAALLPARFFEALLLDYQQDFGALMDEHADDGAALADRFSEVCGLLASAMHDRLTLHDAVRRCRPAELQRVLASGADVNALDEFGLAPLHYAVGWTRHKARAEQVIRMLYASGADPSVCDRRGFAPLERLRQLRVPAGEAEQAFVDELSTWLERPEDVAEAVPA